VVVNCLLIAGCFGGAAALAIGQHFVGNQRKLAAPIVNLADQAAARAAQAGPVETFPKADPQARNFLITGADNNACVAPDSPYAAAFGDRTGLGERSDTIMILRVDPSTSQAAMLSFPRDLWVDIAGRNGASRINSAYVKNDPSTLIATIYKNFGIGIDHTIQVDFCAFKTLVDAVGGVTVPFAQAVRDVHTGLDVPQPGCFTFTGDHALAYVRSRHFETYDQAKNTWTEDPLADLGRISRQQDFIRRVIAKALKTGVYTPSVLRGLIRTAQQYVVTDRELTVGTMLQFAGVVESLNPANLRSYQIEVARQTRDGNDVLVPKLGSDTMKAVLAVFRGKAALGNAPDAVTDTAAAGGSPSSTAIPAGGIVTTTSPPTTAVAANPAVPVVTAQSNDKGVVPPQNVQC